MGGIQKLSIFALRIATGWLMFYAGITKILDPEWSAVGYLEHAKTFPEFFQWFLQPNILPFVNFVNEWGLTVLGISLLLGVAVRLSSILGAALMLLYYLPVLDFPYISPYYYIVDDHLIYLLVLVVLAAVQAGRFWGIDKFLSRKKGWRSWI